VSDAAGLTRFAARAEQMGYDSLWAGDRLFLPVELKTPFPGTAAELEQYQQRASRGTDPFVTLAIAIAATTRVRFNFSTLNAPLYEPIGLARALTTLDVPVGS
jgi:alkanesulfonate monooxygenase SsuD/methylene tetrahydromethanopterin reductase-like flavin-dependent oxidoreductase (luciferase family)